MFFFNCSHTDSCHRMIGHSNKVKFSFPEKVSIRAFAGTAIGNVCATLNQIMKAFVQIPAKLASFFIALFFQGDYTRGSGSSDKPCFYWGSCKRKICGCHPMSVKSNKYVLTSLYFS